MLRMGQIIAILVVGISFVTIPVYALEVGLIEGQWVKYKLEPIEIEATNELLRLGVERVLDVDNFEILDVPIKGVDWIQFKVTEVSGFSYTIERSMKRTDATETVLGTSKEHFQKPSLIPIAIPIDVALGEKISFDFLEIGQATVSTVTTKNFGGQKIDIFEINAKVVEEIEGGSLTEKKIQAYYDKDTGILLGFEMEVTFANLLLGSASVKFKFEALEVSIPVLSSGGCLIATATFGSELATQVQQLRELRDNILLQTNSGSTFMTGFNKLYYSFSPTIADWERQNPVFKEAVKLTITPLITSLSLLNYVDMDSEAEVLGYGISLIILNVGMYFVAPVGIVVLVRRKF